MGSLFSLFQTQTYYEGDVIMKHSANYLGKWKSLVYPTVFGEIDIYIPKFKIGQHFKCEAVMKYDNNSTYKAGKKVKMDIDGLVVEGNTGSGSSNIKDVVPTKVMVLTNNQNITYTINNVGNMNKLTGGYQSSSPYDIGTFNIFKV